MTFDDGPNEGTPYVLDALKEVGVRATFFINSDNLHDDDPGTVAKNKESLIRMVEEGHVIGDHSYDHMSHNTIGDTPRNAYVGLDSDITWFGQKSIDPATLTLKEAGWESLDSFLAGNIFILISRFPRGCNQLCDQHNVELHQASILQQLEGWFCESRLLSLHITSFIRQVSDSNI